MYIHQFSYYIKKKKNKRLKKTANDQTFLMSLSTLFDNIKQYYKSRQRQHPDNVLVLHPFEPFQSYVIYQIHRLSSIIDLETLIKEADKTIKMIYKEDTILLYVHLTLCDIASKSKRVLFLF